MPSQDVVRRHPVLDQGEQLAELLGEVVRRGVTAVALERQHRHRVGAGRAAETEVDPAGWRPASVLNTSATFSGL